MLMLGGGGYHNTNAARAWAYLTGIALDRPYDLENKVVPLSNPHWETFYNDNAHGEGLDIPSHLSKRDENTEEDISLIVGRFREYAKALSG